MRIAGRLSVPLIGTIVAVLFGFACYRGYTESHVQQENFAARTQSLSLQLASSIESLLEAGAVEKMDRVLTAFSHDSEVLGAAVLDPQQMLVAQSADFIERSGLRSSDLSDIVGTRQPLGSTRSSSLAKKIYYTATAIHRGTRAFGTLAVMFDMAPLSSAQTSAWTRSLRIAAVQTAIFAAVVFFFLQWRLTRPLTAVIDWTRQIRTGHREPRPESWLDESFRPLLHEVSQLAANWREARASADHEARLRDTAESVWTRERLRVFLEKTLEGSRLFVVSNRQPYEHIHKDGKVEVRVPASGLVTAMEPILQACDGTWIAHGAGTADRSAVDSFDRLPVPTDSPKYTLRRVWLTPEEEAGYYYGFANEGLWPLCHIAHTRPSFRHEDWIYYNEVNQKFAQAVLEEMRDCEKPLVLVQDYHFALLPQLVKQVRPEARVAIFWHIPWPNPEAFGICPWQEQLLEGLLAADLVGFHTQAHCINFMQTVDHVLESRIEYDRGGITRGDRFTAVRPFPISVETGRPPVHEPDYLERAKLLQRHGPKLQFLGIGVDRLDYTKGIPERFQGLERFLDVNPAYRERIAFVQIGAPTRTNIKRYQDIVTEIRDEAARINQKFGTRDWSPIVLLDSHHTHEQIQPYYRLADFCMVTSLHDGMNLVAKEYVASRADESGALILSRFAGASNELEDALLVNPYHVEEVGEAIRQALEMSPEERRDRMRRMRTLVEQRNIYWWAAQLVGAIADVRLEKPGTTRATPEGYANDQKPVFLH